MEHANKRPQATPDQLFGARVTRMARQQCERLLGTKAGQQAGQRITMAILGAMQTARDPSAFHHCTDLSLANCIALSAQTNLMPGGPNPTVYLVPQSARRGEPPELQWRITHRGIAVLAYRSGFAIRAVPVGNDDFLRVSLGEVIEHVGSSDSWPTDLDDIGGIAVCVKDLERGADVIRAWVPRQIIAARRNASRSYKKGFGPWVDWGIEMAQGAAIRYTMARGMVPIDSPELAVALFEDRKDVVDVTVEEPTPPAAVSATVADPFAQDAPALTHDQTPDDMAEFNRQREQAAQRQTVEAEVNTGDVDGPNGHRDIPPTGTDPKVQVEEARDRLKARIDKAAAALGEETTERLAAQMSVKWAGAASSIRAGIPKLQELADDLEAELDSRQANTTGHQQSLDDPGY